VSRSAREYRSRQAPAARPGTATAAGLEHADEPGEPAGQA
jgi:hypothetical protein